MPTHVALLRGINVGRHAQVGMAALREVFTDLGQADVTTVLRSGNVVFTADDTPAAEVAARIEAELHRRVGVRSAVLVLAEPELAEIVAGNPLRDVATDPSRLLVTVLAAPPDVSRLDRPDAAALVPEVLEFGTRAVYQWCPDGISTSKVPLAFWRQFGTGATSRNWRTVTRLLDLLHG